jgi:hypothetical protein
VRRLESGKVRRWEPESRFRDGDSVRRSRGQRGNVGTLAVFGWQSSAGGKSGVKRLAGGARRWDGSAMARNANPYDFANDAGHVMDVATADKLEEHPELLSVPLDNIARWIATGRHTTASVKRLEQWRVWITDAQQDKEAFRRLLDLLRDDSEEARHWKSWSPFAGVLEAGEVSAIYESCLS